MAPVPGNSLHNGGDGRGQALAALVALLLLLTVAAAPRLNADLLFVDEYWSIRNSGGAYYGPLSPVDIWRTMAEVDPGGMGVLYHWLLAGWFALVGTSEWTLRAFSLLAGLLAVAAVYRLGRAVYGGRAGLAAAILLGTGAFYIDYLHEGRAYTLLALLATLTTAAAWRIVSARRAPGPGPYVALAAGMAALAYTHYIALAMGAALGLYLAGVGLWAYRTGGLRDGRGRRAAGGLLALAAGGVLFLPWLEVTLGIIRRGAGETTRQATAMDAAGVLQMLLHTFSSAGGALLVLLLCFALPARGRHGGLLWAWLLVVLALILGVNALIPFMVHPRYLLVLFPALALLAGAGVAALARRGLPAGLLLLIVGGAGLYHTLQPGFIAGVFGQIYRAPKAGVDLALAHISRQVGPQDLTLFHIAEPGFEPFQFFVLDYLMHGRPGRYDQFQRLNNSFARSDNAYLEDVRAALQEAPFVYTLIVPAVPLNNLGAVTQYALEAFYADCGRLLERPDLVLTRYARPPQGPPLATFDAPEGLALSALAAPLLTGDTVAVTLGWQSDRLPPLYSVGLHVYDAAGQFVAQADAGLPERRPFACQTLTASLAGLPPGAYRLEIIVYNWQTGARLTAGGAESVLLAQVER
ncbi:MAG: glycosyltransferase family 39 protein [Anaerolineae bacterium]|jgi:hypothetical protein|nr:glycosyltransferase family 39 protein [Anaerolineae bacterium]